MNIKKVFTTFETHTAGQPTRTVIGGIPNLKGDSVSEKMIYMKENLDWIRKTLMFEPRGNNVMSGAILCNHSHPDADVGVIYIEVGGYLPMCGHDTIGFSTVLVETGMVDVVEPKTQINIETPAGLVKVDVEVDNNIAKNVQFDNIPSFLYKKDLEIDVPKIGPVKMDISYGGNFFALVNANDIGLEIKPENEQEIIKMGNMIKDEVNKRVDIVHPEKSFIKGLTHIEFYDKPDNPKADVKNAVVIPPGAIDRSPCGTGTSAKVATLYSRGELKKGETFVHESIIGTLFEAKVVEETKVGDLKAVIPRVKGSAYMIGMHRFFIDEEDPIKNGYLLGVKTD